MAAYYNEFKPEAAHMLRQLIKDGLIAPGEVDERSITEVTADDVKGFTQCHFFAGIGGWSVALRHAGWADDRPVWTGSCPCQPFSTAGKQKGKEDERHLWPVWAKLIAEVRPSIIFGEQVSSAISHGWLDGVYADMEAEGYACGSAVLPACSVDAPHKRDRLWFVADAELRRCERQPLEQCAGIQQKVDGKKKSRQSIGSHGSVDVAYPAIDDDRRNSGEVQEKNGAHEQQYAKQHGSSCYAGGNMGDPEHDGRDGCQIAGSDETPVLGCAEGQNGSCQLEGASDTGAISEGSISHAKSQQDRGICQPNTQPHVGAGGALADSNSQGLQGQRGFIGQHDTQGWQEPHGHDTATGFWDDHEWIVCGDNKIRRIPSAQSGICIVAHGLQHRAPLLHALGNAIVPEVASRFIKACM